MVSRKNLIICLLLFALAACHRPSTPHDAAWDELSAVAKRERLVQDAWEFSGQGRLNVADRSFPDDCSGLVGAVLYKNGIDVFEGASELSIRGNGVLILRQFVARYGDLFQASAPRPGDLAFFSNTYDRNRDGRMNDPLTHVAIVEKVDPEGTVTFIHNVRDGVRRYVMNLQRPHTHTNSRGEIVNSYLRKRKRSDGRSTPYLAGSLFTEYGSLIRNARTAGR